LRLSLLSTDGCLANDKRLSLFPALDFSPGPVGPWSGIILRPKSETRRRLKAAVNSCFRRHKAKDRIWKAGFQTLKPTVCFIVVAILVVLYQRATQTSSKASSAAGVGLCRIGKE